MSVILANVLFFESIIFPIFSSPVSFERTLARKHQVCPSRLVFFFLKHRYYFLFPMWILICYCVFSSLEILLSSLFHCIPLFLAQSIPILRQHITAAQKRFFSSFKYDRILKFCSLQKITFIFKCSGSYSFSLIQSHFFLMPHFFLYTHP